MQLNKEANDRMCWVGYVSPLQLSIMGVGDWKPSKHYPDLDHVPRALLARCAVRNDGPADKLLI